MTVKDRVNNAYFKWLMDLVCGSRFAKTISYEKLLTYLHSVTFTFTIGKDANRAFDGEELRYRYALEQEDEGLEYYLNDRPCSILEMMIALAIRGEESIMDNPNYGNRTGQWFWRMINNLGLSGMLDHCFDIDYVMDTVDRFLNRDYEPDGTGGLFRIKNCDKDLRKVEIWYQYCWYLNTLE